jgi:ferredoxin
MTKLKIIINRPKCIAAGNCIETAPETFALDERSKAIVINPEGNDDDTIIEAARSCPTDAITIIDAETGEQIWPEE